MKVLGISFGRKMKCSEIMVKEALYKAKEAGAEVEFISTVNMEIGHCKGCGACSTMRDRGGQVKCIIKDDYLILEEAVLNADAIILAAPVFAVGTVGQFKNFVDRFGPAHDRAALEEEQKKRLKEGKTGDELLDPRYFKDRYVGYISVGGASTQNWVSLGLPLMHLFGFSCYMKAVGHIDAYDQGRKANPVFDTELIKQCGDLGRKLAESVGRPYDEIEWMGERGVCPVCHNNLLSIGKDCSTNIECPVCGITGNLEIQNNKIIVTFSEEQKNRARSTMNGLYEHYYEIQGMKEVCIPKLMANKDTLPKMLEKYEKFDEYINQ
ncbi:flavodoxin family protein [Anaerocolumna sp. MB42-C2]|uniref:flavodoxin family protein n=1 Tax=Anaerocolumna sp. MB42-C2 TaxID=3070997 RepID=UPI0027DEEC7D|nr:flavodoxin family protein [Anaerocolumna sp. MB42-C2]WMJ90117.1 flavodoxin family protein [Anaerocolumna sp. MB42-C2]